MPVVGSDRDAAPVHAAGAARELDRRLRRRVGRLVAERRERPVVVKPPLPFHHRRHAAACSGVVSSAVTRSASLKLARASGGGRTGNRLRRRIPLGRHVAFRHGLLLDRINGLPVCAIRARRSSSTCRPARSRARAARSALNSNKRAGRRHVRVPEIVMHGLEVPQVFAGRCIHRDDRVAVHVVAGTIAAVVVRRRDRRSAGTRCRARRRSARRSAHMFVPPRSSQPSPQVSLNGSPGLWDGLELPQLRARAHVERARIAGGPLRHFAARGADDRDVAIDRRRAAVADADVDVPSVPKPADGLAGCRIERHQVRAAHEQDTRRECAVAGPVAHAACRRRGPRAAAGTPAPVPPGPGAGAEPEAARRWQQYAQTVAPVSPSSATTRSRLGTYIIRRRRSAPRSNSR